MSDYKKRYNMNNVFAMPDCGYAAQALVALVPPGIAI
jgi:hypothetical protein